MKKSILKQKLHQAIIQASLYQQSFEVLVSEFKEVSEALDRRRQLCKTMEELVNRGQPKSMEEMARDLCNTFHYNSVDWDGERQEIKDIWMDKLLKVIG